MTDEFHRSSKLQRFRLAIPLCRRLGKKISEVIFDRIDPRHSQSNIVRRREHLATFTDQHFGVLRVKRHCSPGLSCVATGLCDFVDGFKAFLVKELSCHSQTLAQI